MSAVPPDDFLARWTRRKAEVARAEAEEHSKIAAEADGAQASSTQGRVPGASQVGDDGEPFDLSLLPKLEDIVSDTDITIFMQRGVPEDLRNAALRRAWEVTDSIRNYVDPAIEYAWDWNTPGMHPGSELEAGYDTAKQIAGMFSKSPSHTLVESASDAEPQTTEQSAQPTPGAEGESLAHAAGQEHERVAGSVESVDPDPAAVRLSDPAPTAPNSAQSHLNAGKSESTPIDSAPAEAHHDDFVFPATRRRRHGGATPA